MNATYNPNYRGYSYKIAWQPGADRATVDVFHAVEPFHAAFELGIIEPGACMLGQRLAYSVQSWIDGLIARNAASVEA